MDKRTNAGSIRKRVWLVQTKPGAFPRLNDISMNKKEILLTAFGLIFHQFKLNHAERLGYPTQKPLALLDRIIKASSNPNDIVLDAFCGCGTALVAAENLGRQWIGIDVSPTACRVMAKRLRDVCKMKEDEKLWQIGRGFVVRDLPWTMKSCEKSRRLSLRTGRLLLWAAGQMSPRSAIWASTGVSIRYRPCRKRTRANLALWMSGIPFRSSRKTRSADPISILSRRL